MGGVSTPTSWPWPWPAKSVRALRELSSWVGVGPCVPDVIEVVVRLDDTTVEMTSLASGSHRVGNVEIDATGGVVRHAGLAMARLTFRKPGS